MSCLGKWLGLLVNEVCCSWCNGVRVFLMLPLETREDISKWQWIACPLIPIRPTLLLSVRPMAVIQWQLIMSEYNIMYRIVGTFCASLLNSIGNNFYGLNFQSCVSYMLVWMQMKIIMGFIFILPGQPWILRKFSTIRYVIYIYIHL